MFKKMKFNEIRLPSNRKFGFFFTFLFCLSVIYFINKNNNFLAYLFIFLAAIFLSITLFKPNALLPLNKLWMNFGLMLGMIVNPIVLGMIFFFLFTPVAFFMRLFRRDQLRLQIKGDNSYWIERECTMRTDFFKFQF